MKYLPKVVIVDIDGTLSKMGDRSPFEWSKVGIDTPNEPIVRLVHLLNGCESQYQIIVFTGRDEVCRLETRNWLWEHNIEHIALHMRPLGDMRKDCIVKKEMFDQNIKDKYEVLFVLDDRDQVVKMWREELGLTCLQVAPGNF